MATVLTVLEGNGDAAEFEQAERPDWADLMRRFAGSLPERAPVARGATR